METDVVMPLMDGVCLAKKGTQTHPKIRLILASGYADDDSLL